MRKFYVSKSDENKCRFIQKFIAEMNPDSVYVLCETDREAVFKGIEAKILPLKEINKHENWIDFVKYSTQNSLVVIDNVLKFIFFGDGKKKYLKDISQSINNIIVMDVVPFYTEPYEIFYPFFLLGKDILGYNSYRTFKGNHLEEKEDGIIDFSLSFNILKDKIKDYYQQDYKIFWENRKIVEWQMTDEDILNYESVKNKEIKNFTNPIKLYNTCSECINLIETKFRIVNYVTKSLKGNVCLVINCLGVYPNKFLKHMENKNVSFLTFHSSPKKFDKFDIVVLVEMPIVKPHSWFYIESRLSGKTIIQLKLTKNNLENYFYSKIFDNETRKQIDRQFYSPNL